MAIPDLTTPPTDRRSNADDGPRLFERGPLLAEFEAIFTRTLQVPSRCMAIEGSWGSGRTALINAACDTARRGDCLVLRARGGSVETQVPFAVLGKFVESAAVLAGGSEPAQGRADALHLLLASGAAHHPDPATISPLFHSLILSLRELGPVLMAVDDADLADRETLAVLQYVVRRLEDQQIWLLVTARPHHPGVGLRPVDALLSESETRQFILEPLQSESVRTMLAGYFGEEPHPAFTAAYRQATGGIPLFLKILLPCLDRWHVRPTAESADRAERVPAPKITQLVLGRLAQLPVAATDLLQACAVLGDGADPNVASQLAKIDALAAERAADAAGHMELLRPGRPLAFSSPLIRWAIYYDIPTARRSQLHSRAAQLLDEHGAPEITVAEHLLATEPAGDVETAQRLQQMGRAALATGDPHLAIRCLNRALAESPPAFRSGSLYLDLASVEIAQGKASALSHFRRAVQLGVADDGDLKRVAVDLLHHVAHEPHLRGEAARVVQELAGGTEGVDRDLAVEFELALAMARTHPADRGGGLTKLRALLAGTSETEPGVPLMARTFISLQEAVAGTAISADKLASVLQTVADPDQLTGSDPLVTEIQTMVFYGLLWTDRFAVVDDLLQTALRGGHDGVTAPSEQRASVVSATSLLWQGSLTAAEEAYRRGQALDLELGVGLRGRATLGLIDALLRQGRTGEAEDLLSQLELMEIDSPVFESTVRIERGRMLVARGDLRKGLDQYLGAGKQAVKAGIVNPAISSWRVDAAMVLSTLDDWDEAQRLAGEHLALARRFGAARAIGVGLRGAAAATRDLQERTTLLAEAVDLLEPTAARLEAAYALVELGTVLVERGKKEEARGVLRRGVNVASLCGAHQLVESAGIQLRAAGARPRRLGTTGPESLTPSERRVARLAAAGKTNQGIAADLYVTVKTVEGHLAKTYRKLGVDSRHSLALVLGDDDDGGGGDLLHASSI